MSGKALRTMIVIGLTRSNEEEEEARAVGLKLDVYRLASYVRDRRDGGGGEKAEAGWK